jgi:hypothetical protein
MHVNYVGAGEYPSNFLWCSSQGCGHVGRTSQSVPCRGIIINNSGCRTDELKTTMLAVSWVVRSGISGQEEVVWQRR